MSARSVHYICRKHGEFIAHIKCGFGNGPAPLQLPCTADGCFRIADRRLEAQRKQKLDNRRLVSVTAKTYDRLKRHCDAQGISMAQWIEAHTQDIGGGE